MCPFCLQPLLWWGSLPSAQREEEEEEKVWKEEEKEKVNCKNQMVLQWDIYLIKTGSWKKNNERIGECMGLTRVCIFVLLPGLLPTACRHRGRRKRRRRRAPREANGIGSPCLLQWNCHKGMTFKWQILFFTIPGIPPKSQSASMYTWLLHVLWTNSFFFSFFMKSTSRLQTFQFLTCSRKKAACMRSPRSFCCLSPHQLVEFETEKEEGRAQAQEKVSLRLLHQNRVLCPSHTIAVTSHPPACPKPITCFRTFIAVIERKKILQNALMKDGWIEKYVAFIFLSTVRQKTL